LPIKHLPSSIPKESHSEISMHPVKSGSTCHAHSGAFKHFLQFFVFEQDLFFGAFASASMKIARSARNIDRLLPIMVFVILFVVLVDIANLTALR